MGYEMDTQIALTQLVREGLAIGDLVGQTA